MYQSTSPAKTLVSLPQTILSPAGRYTLVLFSTISTEPHNASAYPESDQPKAECRLVHLRCLPQGQPQSCMQPHTLYRFWVLMSVVISPMGE